MGVCPLGADVDETIRLNLGAGVTQLRGYTAVDRNNGSEVYPLAGYAESSVAEIRASHVLEHFSHKQVGDVLADWVRALKPGGQLKIAVPNFDWIAKSYLSGEPVNVQGYVMGGHVNGDDHHGCIFDAGSLSEVMRSAGLRNIRRWRSEIDDCAALPVSLNLAGEKPSADAERPLKIAAAMSVPRLGFMDNFFCAYQALLPLKIELRKHTGAFWGQCLERCIEQCLEEDADYVLTIDYDTVFSRAHVAALIELARTQADADAIAPIQASRTKPLPLMSIKGADGKNLGEVPVETFEGEATRIDTAHFGLTLLRASALRTTPKPWFKGEPDKDGLWSDARTDDDIWFWRQWAKAGHKLYLANRVAVGHAELMVRWPGRDFVAVYQHPSEFFDSGPPEDCWK